MSSVRVVMVTRLAARVGDHDGEAEGAARLGPAASGVAVLITVTVGSTLVSVTVASSVSVAVVPSLSMPMTVTTSVWAAPASPVKFPVNEQV